MDIKAKCASLKSPIISVKVKERGFSYESFGALCESSSGAEEKDNDCASVMKRISILVESAFDDSKENLNSVIAQMLDIRKSCSGRFPVIARQISGWIFDLVMVRGKQDLISALCQEEIYDIPLCAQFRIYDYFSGVLQSPADKWKSDKLVSALRHFCTYDFALSEVYKENRELYENILRCAIPKLIEYHLCENGEEMFLPCVKSLERTSFGGLCTGARCIKQIEIEYFSFSECERATAALTEAVRYCENLVRQALCINSRITGISLSAAERRLISDAVRCGLPGVLPSGAKVGRKPGKSSGDAANKVQSTASEKMPEPINLDVDFGKARELLEKSWQLSELFESDEDDMTITLDAEGAFYAHTEESVSKEKVGELSSWESFALSLTDCERQILSCILCGGDVSALSRSLGGMPHGFADAINEKALDAIGDILIETNGAGVLSVFEDYTEELSGIMNKNTGGDING